VAKRGLARALRFARVAAAFSGLFVVFAVGAAALFVVLLYATGGFNCESDANCGPVIDLYQRTFPALIVILGVLAALLAWIVVRHWTRRTHKTARRRHERRQRLDRALRETDAHFVVHGRSHGRTGK
jgi:hypothetical protein